MDRIGHNQSPNAIHLKWFGEENSGEGGEPQGGAAGASAQGLFSEAGKGGAGPSDKGAASGSAAGAQGSADGQGTDGNQAAGTQTITLPGYAAGLSAKMKADPKAVQYASKFKSFDELMASGMELESKLGASVRIPNEQSTPEEIAAYRKIADVPEKAEDYKLDKFEGVKTTPEQEKAFRDLSHKYNLSQATARAFWNAEQEAAKAEIENYVKQTEAEAAKLDETLKAKWGNDFPKNVGIAKRGTAAYASPELLEAIERRGMGNEPSLILHFYDLGLTTKEESTLDGNPAGIENQRGFEYPGIK